uniref:Uncharacterized protein n=1 Tax=Oryza brachyantha TaxID=4533 RepID=J3LD34_ORYBR
MARCRRMCSTKPKSATRRSAMCRRMCSTKPKSATRRSAMDSHSFHSRNQKGIRAAYALEKDCRIRNEDKSPLYDVMRKEVGQAV